MPTDWKQIIPSASVYDPNGFRERVLDTGFTHLRIGFSVNSNKDDDWAVRKALEYGGFDAPEWRRENCIDYDAYSGQRLWPMLSREEHNSSMDISECTLYRVIDQGIRHPTVCLWVAVNRNGDRHIYREYYSVNRSIAMNCRAIIDMTPEDEHISMNLIDPATRKRNEETLKTVISVYEENGLYCYPADNSFAGYDAVSTSLLSTVARNSIRKGAVSKHLADLNPSQDQLLHLAKHPSLTFDLRFTNRCFTECGNLRWQETKSDVTQFSQKEKPVDKDDDGPDCVRYAVQSQLFYKGRGSNTIKILPFRKMTQLKIAKRNNDKMYDKLSHRAQYYER